MKKALIVCFLFSVLSALGRSPSTPTTPSRIESRFDTAQPLWLRVDAALTPSGLSPELGESIPGLQSYLQAQQQAARGRTAVSEQAVSAADRPCGDRYLGQPIEEHFEPTDTPDDLLRSTRTAFLGKIIASSQGFYLGTPGTLLTVDVERIVKNEDFRTPAVSYVFFPYARIVTANGAFCSNPVGTSMRPSVGDSVLVFSVTGPDDPSGTAFRVDPARELALETTSGEKFLPIALRDDASLARLGSLRGIAGRLRSRVDEQHRLRQ